MDNPILEQNISCLPENLRNLLSERKQTDDSIKMIQGKQGWPIAQIKIGSKTIHTNSLVDPLAEARRWAETLDYKDVMVSFIYGCGFGYPLLEYAKRKQPYTETIIFEQNIDLFYAMLSRIDMQGLLRDPSIHFVVGDVTQVKLQMEDILTSDFLLRATKPACFFTWLAHRNEKAKYLELHHWLWNSLQLSLTSVGNSVHDTLVGMYNMIDNVKSALHSSRLSVFRDIFKNKPAFIVANGPSLDKNIDLLQDAKGKALILAAESALKPCLKRDIQPDAVCVIERTPTSYNVHFKNANLPADLVMVGLNLIDPRIPIDFPGPWIPIFRSYESTSKWINEAIGDGSGLAGGASSAHLAFEFALFVGANPIIFVGQDLAFGPNQSTHSEFSSYSEEYLAQHVQILRSQPIFMVKDIYGNSIPTIKIWYEFKTWFEQQIAKYPERKFIDATEGGAYIEGTEIMTLTQTIEQYCHESMPTSLIKQINRFHADHADVNPQPKYQALFMKIDWILGRLHKLVEDSEEDIRNCKQVERACKIQQNNNAGLPAFIESLFQSSTNAFRKYGLDEEIVTFTQSIIFAAHKEINDVGEVDTVERLLQVTKIQRKMFEHLSKTCQLLIQHFELAKNRLEKQTEGIDGADDDKL